MQDLFTAAVKKDTRLDNEILTTAHQGWVEICLNRPTRLNAFTDSMHSALYDALSKAATMPEIRAVLLTGAGRGFCAGQDLEGRDPREMDGLPDLGDTLTALYNPLVRLLRDMPKPVVCVVNGVAAGAGANIALACDIVLAAKSARFIQSFVNVGLIPDAGGSWSLTHLLGPARAKALAMTGHPLSAEQAADWGLIWQAVDDDRVLDDGRVLTAKLASGPTLGLARTKQAINAASHATFHAQLDLEAALQRECGRSADYREGVCAFLEKRTAEFQGA
jgi:2-(1,2-epoxy-1,2-dihydrophenyl)acetyl-CoA isomerase